MGFLENVIAVKQQAASNSGGGANYLNMSAITEDQPARITLLGESSAAGFEVWVSKKPMRFATEPSREDINQRAEELKVTPQGDEKARPFYAFFVWNYDVEKVQAFSFSAVSLIDPIIAALSDEEIGAEPHAYDFKISATGMGMDKRYAASCVPGKRRQPAVDKKIAAAWDEVVGEGCELSNLLVGGDPFKALF